MNNMESVHASDPVQIGSHIVDVFDEKSWNEDVQEEWQDLEQFWDEEKRRLDVDVQTNLLSSSLEKHLLFDDYIREPTSKAIRNKNVIFDENLKIIKGEDIKDIPASYVTGGFEPHELIVIGTYVDSAILPGFQYRVRKNLTEEYLFNGKAHHLESIGLGYGKRLTFQDSNLNNNSHYFWSDSRQDGYGFTFQSMQPKTVYRILENLPTSPFQQEVGRVVVKDPAMSPDIELETVVNGNGSVEKTVYVHFRCDAILQDEQTEQNVFVEDIEARGMVSMVRESSSSRAAILKISLEDFILKDCILLPEE